jgi:hypothetical protein
VTDENRRGYPEQCKAGSATCYHCPSGLSCIPGACSEALKPGEPWNLHISAIGEDGPNPSKDTCQSLKGAWVRLKVSGTEDWTDVPLADPCSHRGRAERGIPIVTEDLTGIGLDVEIHDGSADGPLLAWAYALKNTRGFRRKALCSGMKLGPLQSTRGSSIAYFTFFLDGRR